MPEINYNNPEFEWTLNDKYSWIYRSNSILGSSYPSDMFIRNYTYSRGGSGLTGTCSLDVCLTTFAQQGFLILLSISGMYLGLTPYIGIDGITINYNTVDIKNSETGEIVTHAGTFLIPANTNRLGQVTSFVLQGIKILSYRKRYLRLNTNDLTITIHPSDWTSNFSLLTGLDMNSYTLSGNLLWAHNCFSINTDEWAFYTPQSGETYDIDEFPIWKDNDNNYWSRNVTGSVKSYLKNRGSHFLFNNNNELQKRDLSLINGSSTKGSSSTQIYEALHKQDISASDYTSIYLIQQEYNQIMHKKTSCNQMIPAAAKGAPYKYFNDDKIGSTNVYTDLWDNNKEPTKEKPIILYNNWTQLVYNGINLLKREIPFRFFWVDSYTLYCCNNIYFIPSNWQVSLLNMQGINVSDITATTTDIWNNLSSSSETGGIARVSVKETSLIYNSVNNPAIVCYNISHSNQYISLNQNYFNWDYYDLKSQMIYKINLTSSYGAGFKRSTASSEEALIIGSGINPLTAVINLKAITPHFLPRINDIIDNTCLSVSSFGDHYNNSSNLQIYARQYLSSPSNTILYNYIYTQVTLYASGWNGLLYGTISPYSTSEGSAWPDGTVYNMNSAAYGNAYGFGSNWYTYSQVLYQLQGASNPNAYCIITYDPNL